MTLATNIVKAATGLTLAALIAASSGTSASAETKVTNVGETKHWSILKLKSANGSVMCSAMRKQPGPNKLLLTKSGSNWTVQILNFDWQLGERRESSARLTFAGNRGQIDSALIGGNNFTFSLSGGEAGIGQVAAVRWLTFFSERGRKIGYTLRGHGQAIGKVAECVARNMAPAAAPAPVAKAPQPPVVSDDGDDDYSIIERAARVQQGGERKVASNATPPAPKQNNVQRSIEGGIALPSNAAPAQSAPTAETPKMTRLSREDTKEILAIYLNGSKGKYDIYSEGKGTFKSHTLNYRMKSGVLGAMTAFANSTETAEQMIVRLISEEKSQCASNKDKGQMTVKRSTAEPQNSDGIVTQVAGLSCTSSKGRSIFTYQIATLDSGVVVVVLEGVFEKKEARTVSKPKTVGA